MQSSVECRNMSCFKIKGVVVSFYQDVFAVFLLLSSPTQKSDFSFGRLYKVSLRCCERFTYMHMAVDHLDLITFERLHDG